MALKKNIENLIFAFRRKPWPLEKPRVLQFPVNDICNSRCQMCNIWQQKQTHEISADELRVALSSPLFSEVTNVGINGGEPTLRSDLPILISVLFECLPKVKSISLITNALVVDRTISLVEQCYKVVKEHNGTLDVMVSLDGVDSVHDQVRGRFGNFSSAMSVLELLKLGNLCDSFRVGATIVKDNVLFLHELHNLMMAKGYYIKYRIAVQHNRLYNRTPDDGLTIGKTTWLNRDFSDFNLHDENHLVDFLWGLLNHYEEKYEQRLIYQSLIGQLQYGSPRKAPCFWQHCGATLSSYGELSYCAVESDILGSAITHDAEDLYFSGEAHLREIIRTKCDNCKHDYGGMPEKRQAIDKISYALKLSLLGSQGQQSKSFKNIIRSSLLSLAKIVSYTRDYSHWFKLQGCKPKHNFLELSGNEEKGSLVFCGWYGTETIGDKAILAGILGCIDKNIIKNNNCYIMSFHPEITQVSCQEMDELAGCRVINFQEAVDKIPKSKALIFAGGPLMGVRELANLEILSKLAGQYRVPSIVAGCGVGPIRTTLYRNIIRKILNEAKYCIYRDEGSMRLAQSIGVAINRHAVSEDPSTIWLKSTTSKTIPTRQKGTDTEVIALGLRHWPWQEYGLGLKVEELEKIKRNFDQALSNFLVQFAKERKLLGKQVEYWPISMCTHRFGGDDRFYYMHLTELNPNLVQHLNLPMLNQAHSPRQVVQQFTNADAALCMRFHSVVFAHACNTPLVALDYTLRQGKVKNFAEDHGIPYIPIDEFQAYKVGAWLSSLLSPISITSSDADQEVGTLKKGVAENPKKFEQLLGRALREIGIE